MTQLQFPIETVSSTLSIIIVLGIFFKFFQYKQKLDVLKELDKRKDISKLTAEDKNYIKKNCKEYKEKQIKVDALTRLIFPIFITIAAILFFFLPLEKTLIHLNVIIVLYIYLQVHRIHIRNYAKFLEELNN